MGEHIAVKDLVALGRAMLLPEDDLTLACLLKSPLVGLDEDQLFALAWDRNKASLFERLRERAQAPGPFADAYERLTGWMRQADFMPPFEFYAHLLGAGGGRKRLLARLGPDAAEPIEAFLSQALAYERGHPATLEGFLHWLELGSQDLKRDPEQARDAVRVMTVHGAKGLEAPIVFLADAGPHGRSKDSRLLWLEDGDGELPLWRMARGRRDGRCDRAVEEEERRVREENQRLLYVALTRARDRLYVTGWQTRQPGLDPPPAGTPPSPPRSSTTPTPSASRSTSAAPTPATPSACAAVRRARSPPSAADALAEPAPLPAWAAAPAPPEPPAPRPIAPSRLAGDEPAPNSPAGSAARDRIRHGLLVHRLLQLLPGLPAEDWEEAGERLLRQLAADLPDERRGALLAETLRVLRLPELPPSSAPAAAPSSRSAARSTASPSPARSTASPSRPNSVWILDYKTSRQPPPTPEATPVAYLRQMAAYARAAGPRLPGPRDQGGAPVDAGPAARPAARRPARPAPAYVGVSRRGPPGAASIWQVTVRPRIMRLGELLRRPAAMQRLVFSTDSVPAREQFELWRELGERHLLAVSWHRDGPSGAPFRGSMAVQQLGGARFVDLRCEGHRAVPGRAAAVRAAADVCLIEQEIAGPAQYVIGDRSLACRPGDLLVHAPDARFEQDGPDDWATRIWVVPRRWLFPLLPAGCGPSVHIPRRDGPAIRRRERGGGAGGPAGRAGRGRGRPGQLLPPARGGGRRGARRARGRPRGAARGGAGAGQTLRRPAPSRPRAELGGVAPAVGVSERQLQRLFERTGESSPATSPAAGWRRSGPRWPGLAGVRSLTSRWPGASAACPRSTAPSARPTARRPASCARRPRSAECETRSSADERRTGAGSETMPRATAPHRPGH